MIIVNIYGGLGNQMFQFAFGKALSLNMRTEVLYSIDGFSSYGSSRKFELENAFNVTLPIAKYQDILNVLGSWRSNPMIRRAIASLNSNFICGVNFITEKNFYELNNIGKKNQTNRYFHGYWQSEDYFKFHERVIQKSFEFRRGASISNLETMMRIKSAPSIGVHIRRGDYVSNPKANLTHGFLSVDYYYAAINSVRKRVSNARIFIFTDDYDWVNREMLSKIDNVECVNINHGSNSFRDMQLMSICDHNIIANSSFSWWSAWLNQNPKKIVIAPQRWFSDKSYSDKFLIPASWERM